MKNEKYLEDILLSEEVDELYLKIGKNVKKYREAKNMTQLDLSLKMNYKSSAIISNNEIYYRKKYFFSIKQLFFISKILEIPISKFFE